MNEGLVSPPSGVCQTCEDAPATRMCEDCDAGNKYFCEECFDFVHRKGAKKKHRSVEIRRCSCAFYAEFLFVPIFVALTCTIAYYGFQGLKELTEISPCAEITPPYDPAADPQLTDAYDGCLQYFARLSSRASDYCSTFAVQKIGELTVPGRILEQERELEQQRELQSITLPPIAQEAYSNCLVYIAQAEQGTITYDTLKDYALKFTIENFPETVQTGAAAWALYSGCMAEPGSSDVDKLLECVKEKFTPLLGAVNTTILTDSCVGPAVKAAEALIPTDSNAGFDLQQQLAASELQQAVVLSVQQCAYTVISGQGGNPLFLQASQLAVLVKSALETASDNKLAIDDSCLGDAIANPASASKCVVKAGMALEELARPICEDFLQVILFFLSPSIPTLPFAT